MVAAARRFRRGAGRDHRGAHRRFTSATLQLGGSFDTIAEQLGLAKGSWVASGVEQPFRIRISGDSVRPRSGCRRPDDWPTPQAQGLAADLVAAAVVVR